MDDVHVRGCFVMALAYLEQLDQLIDTRIRQNQTIQNAIQQQKRDQFGKLSKLILQGAQALRWMLFAMYEKACINKIYESGHGEWRDIAACLRIDAVSPVESQVSAAFLIHDIATQPVSEITQDEITMMRDVCEIVHDYLIRLQQMLDGYRQKIEVLLA